MPRVGTAIPEPQKIKYETIYYNHDQKIELLKSRIREIRETISLTNKDNTKIIRQLEFLLRLNIEIFQKVND